MIGRAASFGSAGSGSSLRSAGTRGGFSSRPAALPHSLAVPAAAVSAPFQVLAPIVPRVAALGRPSVAAEVFEEVQLSNPSVFHADHSGVETFGDVRNPFRDLRNA